MGISMTREKSMLPGILVAIVLLIVTFVADARASV
jgi:hypothetical protein